MASISRDPNGRRRILFVAPDGSRKTIRLGKTPQRTAEAVKVKVEALVVASITNQAVDDETARWVAGLDAALADRLAKVGLIPKRAGATLGPFICDYIESRRDVGAATAKNYHRARCDLVGCFGADKPLRDLTPGDGDNFRLYLLGRGLAENTARRLCGYAKQFLHVAVRRRLIPANPFADLKSAVRANVDRFYFVTREETEKVIDACPDAQWRLLVALSRYGGLRCPSEHLALRWADVDWERDRITVPSPKTTREANRGSFPCSRSYARTWKMPGGKLILGQSA